MIEILKRLWNVGNDLQQKGWYSSKTVWFNVLSLVAALVALKGYNIDANDVATLSAGIVTVVNIVLRFNSDTPVGIKKIDNIAVPTGSDNRISDGSNSGGD